MDEKMEVKWCGRDLYKVTRYARNRDISWLSSSLQIQCHGLSAPISTVGIWVLNIIWKYQQSHALQHFDQTQLGPLQPHRNSCKAKGSVLQEVLHRTFQGPRGVLCLIQGQWELIDKPVHASFAALLRITCLHLPRQNIFSNHCIKVIRNSEGRRCFSFPSLNFLENKTCKIKSGGLAPLARSLLIRKNSEAEQTTATGTLHVAYTPFKWSPQVIQMDF